MSGTPLDGIDIPAPGWAVYGASKTAFDAWLRAVAPELAPHGVGVTSIHLPLVRTAMSAPTYGMSSHGSASTISATPGCRIRDSEPTSRASRRLASSSPTMCGRSTLSATRGPPGRWARWPAGSVPCGATSAIHGVQVAAVSCQRSDRRTRPEALIVAGLSRVSLTARTVLARSVMTARDHPSPWPSISNSTNPWLGCDQSQTPVGKISASRVTWPALGSQVPYRSSTTADSTGMRWHL